jgi:hypothetical protein
MVHRIASGPSGDCVLLRMNDTRSLLSWLIPTAPPAPLMRQPNMVIHLSRHPDAAMRGTAADDLHESTPSLSLAAQNGAGRT